MKESFLLKLALIFSIIGLFILFLISGKIEINETTIEKINNEEIDDLITITGEVKEITKTDSVTFIVIRQFNDVKTLAFSNIDVKKNDLVRMMYCSTY